MIFGIGPMLQPKNKQKVMDENGSKQTTVRNLLGNLAPKFAELNDDVLFGEVWSWEEQLSPRDRIMISIAALFSA